jgi:hypothetical protein
MVDNRLYPTQDWMIEAYPGWASIWLESDAMWTLEALKLFEKCPADIEERLNGR